MAGWPSADRRGAIRQAQRVCARLVGSWLIGRQANNRNVIEPFTINWTTIDGYNGGKVRDSHIWASGFGIFGTIDYSSAMLFSEVKATSKHKNSYNIWAKSKWNWIAIAKLLAFCMNVFNICRMFEQCILDDFLITAWPIPDNCRGTPWGLWVSLRATWQLPDHCLTTFAPWMKAQISKNESLRKECPLIVLIALFLGGGPE